MHARVHCLQDGNKHVIRFLDLLDLWVIKIKKPIILCTRSTSRSREQSTKPRSGSENMRKVCLFYKPVSLSCAVATGQSNLAHKRLAATKASKVWFSYSEMFDSQVSLQSFVLARLAFMVDSHVLMMSLLTPGDKMLARTRTSPPFFIFK